MKARLLLAMAVAVSFTTLALGEDDKAKIEHRSVTARVVGGAGSGVGINAKTVPAEFTVPEGRTAKNFKFRLDDPQSNVTSDKLSRSSIYSITEQRNIREAENNPKLELPPGRYRFIIGGRPGAQGSLAFDLVPDDTPDPDDSPKAKVEHRWVRARVVGGAGSGVGVDAKMVPTEFTVPEGRTAKNFKYRIDDPKDNFTSDRLTRSSIYSITEQRYIREAENNPRLELPPGKYRFIIGGRPGAQGSLAFDLVPDDMVGTDDSPAGSPKPKGRGLPLKLPKNFDVKAPQLDASGTRGGVVFVTDEPCVFRFRGDQVSGVWQYTVKWVNSAKEQGESIHRHEFVGTFRHGVLRAEGTNTFEARRAGKGAFAKSWTTLKLHGQANADGLLSIEVEETPIRYLIQVSGEWKENENWVKNWPAAARKWSAPIVLQLPVGKSQRSQELSAPPERKATPEQSEYPAADHPAQPGTRRTSDTPGEN